MDVLFFIIGLISCTTSMNYQSIIDDTTLTTMGDITMSISISDLDDKISISITGPTIVYYSIGIGSCEMSDSYALVIPGSTATDGTTPFEQLLGKNAAGSTLDSTFTIEQDTTSDLLRTVIFSRTLSTDIDDDSYYKFSTDDDELMVMWAYGTKADYSNHGEYQHGCNTLSFTKTLQNENIHKQITNKSSADSLYFFGHSSKSLIFIVILLGIIFFYALFTFYKNYYKSHKKLIGTSSDEMKSLISDDNIVDKYTAI
eukprot:178854_1